jgi:hypothetical protein
MIDRFLILAHSDPRPDAERIIFCDGAGGRIFREGTDLDLSHWRPNRTPRQYRAGTSTEIGFRFLDAPLEGDWTLAVNNHLDVDGLLSVYVLTHSPHALAHRQTIVAAAEMGDFWGWGEPPAQRLFQGFTRLMDERSAAEVPTQAIYEELFHRLPGLIDGTDPDSATIDESLAPLRAGVVLVEEGRIRRVQHGERFAQYVIPAGLFAEARERAGNVPEFNEAISARSFLWPQARGKWDTERICLVSTETPAGWWHDLWFPGYLWADTENRWIVPGIQFHDDMQTYDLRHEPLFAAVRELEEAETGSGHWSLGNGNSPFSAECKLFPVVLRFSDESGAPAGSALDPALVAQKLSGVFG